MDRLARLDWLARATYYLGWIATVIAGMGHVAKLGTLMESRLNVTPYNLLDVALLMFLACVASALRAHVLRHKQ